MKKLLLVLVCLSGSLRAVESPRVVLIVIDGVRAEESVNEKVMPYLQELKKTGISYENFQISNSQGVSLPAYADIFSGNRQKEITSNDLSESDLHSYSPTVFEEAAKQGKLKEEEIAVISSWKKICPLVYSKKNTKTNMLIDCKSNKPEKYDESRADEDTFANVIGVLKKQKPKLSFIHFGDADEEAHAQTIKPKEKKTMQLYLEALTRSDSYVKQIHQYLSEDTFYKEKTYLFVTTDHGRDDNWTNHGNCLFCESFRKSFLVITGPRISASKIIEEKDHRDIAPTIAQVFGFGLTSATGKSLLKSLDLSAKQATAQH